MHGEDKKPDGEKTTAAATRTATEANPKPAGPLNEAERVAQASRVVHGVVR